MPSDFDVSAWPTLPKARGLFVTGTDTGVGKTLVAGAIARTFRRTGRRVGVFKPVATGCRLGRGGLSSVDAQFLAACADARDSLDDIVPLRYRPAVAPNVAARRAHRPVDLEAIFSAYARVAERSDVLVVEGVGGLLCPISDEFWVIHLARLTALPVVIVSRAGLGTINHTLLTLHAARAAGVTVAGVVINRYRVEPPRPGPHAADAPRGDDELAMVTNPTQIAERGNVKVLAIVPEEAANSVEEATIGPDTDFAISQVPWESLIGRP